MRVGQQSRLAYFWGTRGISPYAPHDVRYEYTWVFGAVCPATGQSAGMIEPYADTAAMNSIFDELSQP